MGWDRYFALHGGTQTRHARARRRRYWRGALLSAVLASALAGCAGAPQSGAIEQTAAVEPGDTDPAEPVNRAIFDANMAADRAVMKPIAQAYQDYVPADIRRGVRNASANLREPVVAANDLLQGHPVRALTSAERFGINTTAGYAGVVDRAAQWNLPPHSADFGQTLAVWGIPEGPFVELPALGPSNVRDAVGSAVGIALDPLSWTGNPALSYLGYARTGAEFVDSRTEHLTDLDELERNSLDFYAALRSVYRQHRQAEIDKARHATDPGD
jgi:phospholipid-binding lipoprotein MlaA